uniref:CID domain-containing protein n=1 Tax=Steinernema glaseri TaxID=37863 RepID=A0A1I7YP29_9BILA
MSSSTDEFLQKRLESIKNTPDSIQTIALWVRHRRGSLPAITRVWTHVYKSSDDTRRLALFYLINELCQSTKMKEKTDLFTSSFFEPIVTAISISKSGDELLRGIKRVIGLFEERKIFSKEEIARMRAAQESETLADFNPGCLAAEVDGYKNSTLITFKGQKLLAHEDFSFTKHLKPKIIDKKEGAQTLEEMNTCMQRAQAFTKKCDEHSERAASLLSYVETAKRYFNNHLRDVVVVEDAYRKYFAGIGLVRRELLEMKRTGVYPGATPPRDAPSPNPMDDPFATVMEYQPMNHQPVLRDSVETVDMEMDDDDNGTPSFGSMVYTPSRLIPTQPQSGNGVAHQNIYIPTPLGPSVSNYSAPPPPMQQFARTPAPPLYTPQQPHSGPTGVAMPYRPAPPKPQPAPQYDQSRRHSVEQRPRHENPPHSQPPPAKVPKMGNANAIPLGAGGPSTYAWRQRMSGGGEAGYGGHQKKSYGNDQGNAPRDYDRNANSRRYLDDRRQSGGRRY